MFKILSFQSHSKSSFIQIFERKKTQNNPNVENIFELSVGTLRQKWVRRRAAEQGSFFNFWKSLTGVQNREISRNGSHRVRNFLIFCFHSVNSPSVVKVSPPVRGSTQTILNLFSFIFQFTVLPTSDQIALLCASWSELYILTSSQHCMCQQINTKTLLTLTRHNQQINSPLHGDSLKMFEEMIDKFKSLNTDSNEFSCLKALVLFNPGELISNLI